MQRLAALVAGAARRRSGGSDCWGIAATLRAFGSSPSPAAAAATPGAAPSGAVDPSRIRNWCICAHVDHGKTTLFDRLLAQCDVSLSGERAMDSGALEKERGITILSKVTSFHYQGHLINALDTPGHADFGGEVERVLSMVDGAVLLVDAVEGPLAQTKFVLSKALARGLAPLVVLNKVDRPAATQAGGAARCDAVASQLFDLFAALGASDAQLDFPGWASPTLPPPGAPPPTCGMAPLLDAIVQHVPPPKVDSAAPFSLCVAMIERDPYVGRLATGRVASGRARVGDRVRVLQHPGGGGAVIDELRITKIEKRVGLSKVALSEAVAGDIVQVAGPGDAAGIADTIAAPTVTQALDPGPIDPPTLSMVFSVNDSPLAGKSGKAVTSRAIGERLMAEAEGSVSLKVTPLQGATESYEVRARGELQLGVLIEGLRREGFEFSVSPPTVVMRCGRGRQAPGAAAAGGAAASSWQENGQRMEPIEEVVVEVNDEHAGAVIEALGLRRGELLEMGPAAGAGAGPEGSNSGGRQRLAFVVPSRGMIQFRAAFIGITRGEGLLQRAFLRYAPYTGAITSSRKGAIVSTAIGKARALEGATLYALDDLASRGTFFVAPGDDVYEGMVIGEANRPADITVNITREKKLTNVRSVVADDKMLIAPCRQMSLEEAIGYVEEDELVEVTPGRVRIRKVVLDSNQRARAAKRAAVQAEA
ncbi:putative GTP-binding protein TypA/BipA like protein [Monoraphidium neglectum]|uniref:Putative GTP-binding protein TypA/BipA like protein n=1 Tax=Monoraphidium neglectum TaxID=145388 RepID=A0A0D2L121_9CHLO|nr:putative GTP-binding protein TypA/BipA like protein [Monoraphidium neglectum]KIZ01064.1 putative GTP-binding protein TypA/BipA like protein [Monoraphidium neglectum]|eukprot:XP_013900083.1 putative GTP-binding protein TypA/BipA like protein [Monoraphidium neglectum]